LSGFLEDEADIFNEIGFSDEEHFHLDRYVNKQNAWYWDLLNPEVVIDKPLLSDQITVRCTFP
jgi:hypothetical protein